MSYNSEQTKFIADALADVKQYKSKTKPYLLAVSEKNQDITNFIFTTIQVILNNRKKKCDFTVYLNALRLVKDLMDLRTDLVFTKIQTVILPIYQELGKFKVKDKSDDRGKFFFSDKPDDDEALKGNSCLRLILESIMTWPTWYPTDLKGVPTKFKGVYDALVKEGVKFPKEINYFKKQPPAPVNEPPVSNVNNNPVGGKSGFANSDKHQKQSNVYENIEEKLLLNKGNKEFLVSLLTVSNERELDGESLMMIVQNFEQFCNSVERYLNLLFTEDDPRKDDFTSQLFMDQEFGSQLIEDVNSYKTKHLKFHDFQEKYIKLLVQNQTPDINNTPAPHKNQSEFEKNTDILEAKNRGNHEDSKQKISEIKNEPILHKDSPKLNNQNEINSAHQSEKYPDSAKSKQHKPNEIKELSNLNQSPIKKVNEMNDDSPILSNNNSLHNIKSAGISKPQSKIQENHSQIHKADPFRTDSEKNFKQNIEERSYEEHKSGKIPYREDSEKNVESNVHEYYENNKNSYFKNDSDKINKHENGHNPYEEYNDHGIHNKSLPKSQIKDNIDNVPYEKISPYQMKSEFQEPKKSNDQVYGFRSEVVSGPKSNASFRKIFENENAFTLEKKPVIANKALKIPEEKITQIMSIKEVVERGWDENSEQRSELDIDIRKDQSKLAEENDLLKEKIMKLTQTKEEHEKHLHELNRTLVDKSAAHEKHLREIEEGLLLSKNAEELARDLAEKEDFINRLQKDNDNLQLENERLSTFIMEKQQENDILRQTINSQNPGSQNELFETLNQLKLENDRLRNTIAEIHIENSQKNSVPYSNSPGPQRIIESKIVKAHSGPDDHENKIFGPVREIDTRDLKKSIEVGASKPVKTQASPASPFDYSLDKDENRLSTYLKKTGKNTSKYTSEDEKVKMAKIYDGPKNFEENFDTNSVMNVSLISVSQANLKFEESPYQSDLIYPFQKPIDYYKGKKAIKASKGRLIVFDKQFFDDIERNMKENISKFKLACVKSKSLLFDNAALQVGLISGVYHHNDKNLLKITVFFGNLTKYELSDIKVIYSGNSAVSLWTKPEVLQNEIEAKQQIKQDLLIDFNQVPFPFIIVKCSYCQNGNFIKISLPIPMTINKFLEPKITDLSSFKFKWKAENSSILKSEIFDLNPKIAKSVYDFKKYFPNLIDLNPNKEYDYVSGVEDYKLCGTFDLDHGNYEVLLKVVAKPDKKALFQVICSNKEPLGELLIKSLVFVFRK